MRKRNLLAVPAGIAAVAALAGCGPAHHPKVSSSASAVASADAAAEQKVINACLAKGTLLTKSGRQAFYTCAAGGMTPAQFQACAVKELTSTSLLTKSGRHEWVLAIGQHCVVAAPTPSAS